jgi:hypothetical protein
VSNYYVKNGMYLNEYGRSGVEEIIISAVGAGERVASVRFASPEIYNQAFSDLITNQKVFGMLKKAGRTANRDLVTSTVSYTKNDDLYIIKINLQYV